MINKDYGLFPGCPVYCDVGPISFNSGAKRVGDRGFALHKCAEKSHELLHYAVGYSWYGLNLTIYTIRYN